MRKRVDESSIHVFKVLAMKNERHLLAKGYTRIQTVIPADGHLTEWLETKVELQ